MRELAMLDTRLFLPPQSATESILGDNPNIIGYCPNCGEPVTKREGRGRQKVFCSKKCCDHYAYEHPNYETWTGIEKRICEYCGKEYVTFRKNSQNRKYCSISCSSKAARKNRETWKSKTKRDPASARGEADDKQVPEQQGTV